MWFGTILSILFGLVLLALLVLAVIWLYRQVSEPHSGGSGSGSRSPSRERARQPSGRRQGRSGRGHRARPPLRGSREEPHITLVGGRERPGSLELP